MKQIGSGELAQRVDLVRFNGPLISELRETLADLAKETGGRVQKTELRGSPDAPITHRHLVDYSTLSDAELDALIAAADARKDSPAGP